MTNQLFHCTNQGKKGFTPEDIETLCNSTNTHERELILKLYLNFLLTLEILEEEQTCEVDFEEHGFFIDNQQKVPFDNHCFLRPEMNEVKFINETDTFLHQKIDADNDLYYCPNSKKWLADADVTTQQPIELDELYYQSKRKATDIRYIPIAQETPFVEERNPKIFENRMHNSFPIGVKYNYKRIDGIVLYLNNKNEIRFAKELTDEQKQKLERLNLFTKKGSRFVYSDESKKTKVELDGLQAFTELSSFESNKVLIDGKRVTVKSIFYLGENDPIEVTTDEIDREEGVYYSDSKTVYQFQQAHIVYTSTDTNEEKYIFFKKKELKKKKITYHFESNTKGVFDKQGDNYQEAIFSKKLTSYRDSVTTHDYKIIYQNHLNEKTVACINSEIHHKKVLMIEGISVNIFPKVSHIEALEVEVDHILILDSESTVNNEYIKILSCFRNSIAHGEFKILDDEIRFCNTQHGKIKFKARVSKDRIEGLMKELRNKVI
ncbi:hypothetical protein KKC13_06875 [bacterium]|nr:hypothetical protein [bacterium]MBU1959267.1 hypothetical protein [bacterium]